MSILRVKKEENYSIIANHCFADERLSYRAVGLLCYLLSKPNDWTVRTSELTKSHKEGRDAVLATISELGHLGYITKEKGFGEVNYTVHEIPIVVTDSQEPENQGTEKPTLLSTDYDKGLRNQSKGGETENQGNATPQSNKGSRKEPRQPQVSAPAASPDLLRFINAYPDHRRHANMDALIAAWDAAIAHEDRATLFVSLQRYKLSWKWTTEPKYVPGILRWLIEERWKIEPEMKPSEPPPPPGHEHPKEGQNVAIWGKDY